MRCRACNECLTDQEATRKEITTGAFIDLCTYCLLRADYTEVPTDAIDDIDITLDIEEKHETNYA